MAISDHLQKIRERLRRGEYTSEAAVSQGIILPTLHELGWPVFDTHIVVPEFSLEGRRVDYALCHPVDRPAAFVEVKKVGFSEGADRQLFEYAFHVGVPMAILTDGQEWSFYLPGEQGRYDERRVYKLDLLERGLDEAAARLGNYLSYDNVCSGASLKFARADYQNVARKREIEAILPKAWSALLNEPDSLLLELVADKVEDLCGYKPDLDVCGEFVSGVLQQGGGVNRIVPPLLESKVVKPKVCLDAQQPMPVRNVVESFSFSFEGKTYQAKSAREVMEKMFRIMAKSDEGFLDRFVSRKHGKKRRYIARDKMELYPGRADLAEEHSVEFVPGWWMGTNYSRSNIQQILELALEVVSPKLRSSISFSVQ